MGSQNNGLNGYFEHSKQIFKLIDKKMLTILRSQILFIQTYAAIHNKS